MIWFSGKFKQKYLDACMYSLIVIIFALNFKTNHIAVQDIVFDNRMSKIVASDQTQFYPAPAYNQTVSHSDRYILRYMTSASK